MAIQRTASAHWAGSGKEGSGHLSTQSTVLHETQYSFNTRFADGIGTNPEELIGAAHAGCFSMKLAFVLAAKGFTADSIDTHSTIVLDNGAVTEARLQTRAAVPGMSAEDFLAAATEAKENCPISKLLTAQITLDASLA